MYSKFIKHNDAFCVTWSTISRLGTNDHKSGAKMHTNITKQMFTQDEGNNLMSNKVREENVLKSLKCYW
jgi:hypothetical protein